MRNIALFLIALTVQGQSVAAQAARRPPNPPLPKTLIVEIPGDVANMAPALNGRRLYYSTPTGELFLYDVASKRTTRITTGAQVVPTSVSARGNRIAFTRSAEGGNTGAYHPIDGVYASPIWTMPLDPRTGLATGPARRASLGNAGRPSVSPDGKWIAFASEDDRKRLAIIPSDGGSERVLLDEILRIEYIKWSPDQRWLYFNVALPESPKTGYAPTLMRIAVADGKREVLAYDEFVDGEVGLSPDGNFLVVGVRASTSGAYGLALMDASGKPIATLAYLDSWLSSSELLSWSGYGLNPLKSISLVDGKVRGVIPAVYAIGTPAWAPDGRSFAILSKGQRGGHHPDSSKLLIANANGRILRTIPLRASESRLVWSPDGRWIAMTERPWFGYQQLLGLGITVVDVASGRTQRLRTAVSEHIANVRWTSDSRHVLYDYSPNDRRVFRRVIRRVGLDGSDVVVRALPSGGVGSGLAFISDTSVLVSDSSGTYVRSLTNDRFVRVWPGPGVPSASPRGDLLAMTPPAAAPGDTAERTRRTADIRTSAGVHVATLRFPSDLVRGVSGSFLFTPDGKSLVAWGLNDATKGCCVLYLAPLDGRPVRTLAEVAHVVDRRNSRGVPPFALSPDGKTLLFTPFGSTKVSTMWSVDISGLLRGARKD